MQPGAFDIDARSGSVPMPGPDLAQSLFDAPAWAAYPLLTQAKDLRRCATLIKIHVMVSQSILRGTANANDLLFQLYSRGVVSDVLFAAILTGKPMWPHIPHPPTYAPRQAQWSGA